MLLCDDNLGKHENSGFKYIKYNPGKQESTGSKNIYMQFIKFIPLSMQKYNIYMIVFST